MGKWARYATEETLAAPAVATSELPAVTMLAVVYSVRARLFESPSKYALKALNVKEVFDVIDMVTSGDYPGVLAGAEKHFAEKTHLLQDLDSDDPRDYATNLTTCLAALYRALHAMGFSEKKAPRRLAPADVFTIKKRLERAEAMLSVPAPSQTSGPAWGVW